MSISNSTSAALRHLKQVKPYEGWSVQQSPASAKVRLLRRSIPVSEVWFEHLALSSQQCVVGIISASNHKAKATVLVEANGMPCRIPRQLTIEWNGAPTTVAATTTTTTTTTAAAAPAPPIIPMSDEDNKKLLLYAMYLFGSMIVLKAMLSSLFLLYVAGFPLAYLYAVQTCPSMASFDAKKELKRVLRGYHLPEDHPDKPKGFFSETVARARATIATETATAMGYEVTEWNVLGACIIAVLRVPSANVDCYWIGALGKWRYLYQSEIPTNKED